MFSWAVYCRRLCTLPFFFSLPFDRVLLPLYRHPCPGFVPYIGLASNDRMVYSIVVTSSEHVIDPARDERGCEKRGMTHRTAPGEFIRPWAQSAIKTAVRKDRRRGDKGCRACRRELLSMRIQNSIFFGVGQAPGRPLRYSRDSYRTQGFGHACGIECR